MNMAGNKKEDFRLFLMFFSIAFLLFCFIYLPLLALPSAQHDDYNFFAWGSALGKGIALHPQSLFTFYFGRPFQGIFCSILMPFVKIPADFAYIRLISIFFAAAATALFAVWFRILNIGRWPVFFISLAIFLLPGVQFYILLIISSPMIIAVFLSLSSALLLNKISERTSFLKLPLYNLKFMLITFIAFLMLLVSIFTYPVSAMFFLVPILSIILFREIKDWKDTRRIVFSNIMLLLLVCLTFYLLQRYIFIPYLLKHYPQGAHVIMAKNSPYKFALSHDLLRKFFTLKTIIIQSLNLWNIYPSLNIPIYSSILIGIGIVASVVVSFKNRIFVKYFSYILQAFFAVVIIIGLSNIPNIAAINGYIAYRTIFPCSAMVLILLTWSVRSIAKVFLKKWRYYIMCTFAGFIAIIFSFSAAYNILENTVDNFLALTYLRARIAGDIANKPPVIHIIKKRNRDRSFLNLPTRNDEFNMLSTCFPLMIHSFLKFNEKHKDGEINTTYFPYVTSSNADQKVIYIPTGTLIINMDALSYPLKGYAFKPIDKYEVVRVNTSSACYGACQSGGNIGANVFDKRGNTIWETTSGYPQWLKITYPQSRELLSYKLQTGANPRFMAKAWILQGSKNGIKWINLDFREKQIKWGINEVRNYKFKNTANYKYYRLFITDGNSQNLRINAMIMKFKKHYLK